VAHYILRFSLRICELVSFAHSLSLYASEIFMAQNELSSTKFFSLIFSNNHAFVKFAMVFKAAMTLQKCSSESRDFFLCYYLWLTKL
jgi:hypothetical protein